MAGRQEPDAETIRALVVVALPPYLGGPKYPFGQRTTVDVDVVGGAAPAVGDAMWPELGSVGHVLDQRSAKRHVQQLESTTDRQQRSAPPKRLQDQLKLEGFLGWVSKYNAGVVCLAVSERMDVSTPDDDDSADVVEDLFGITFG